MIVIYLSVLRGILKEKESRVREGMRMMGMSDFSFYISWIFYYMIITFIISIVCTIMLKISVFEHS